MIQLKNVSKEYQMGNTVIHALQSTTLTINKGDFVCVAGPSGSGKTTLLNLMAGIDTPSSGTIMIGKRKINGLSATRLAVMRRNTIGFVFQSYNLIPVLSIYENIEYILILQKVPARERKDRVRDAMQSVGLEGLEKKRPFELSGGQQQRVAVARAIVGNPHVILADEPTGSLDSRTGQDLIALLQEINMQKKTTFVFSSHDPHIIESARRIINLKDGFVSTDN